MHVVESPLLAAFPGLENLPCRHVLSLTCQSQDAKQQTQWLKPTVSIFRTLGYFAT